MHTNWPIVHLMVRLILGLLFFMAGYWKVFILSVKTHTEKFFIEGFAEYWIPEWLLVTLGYGVPYFELITGFLIIVGLQLRAALIGVGFLLVMTTYGHTLQQPLFDIDGHTFTRLILIVFLLLAPLDANRYSLDFLLKRRS
ncbi:DoxX family protein [Sessilibacter corallicola]|uniref:DoxX family protein n=1 Tax=Sessilibacter corallicola TaxID=2904075 RepID=UPI001E5CB5F1|nr:DoxX family protein [Sessilibacter corallicola]MCE2027813.1 DoxX family protein [Sessilibacter corallicola]